MVDLPAQDKGTKSLINMRTVSWLETSGSEANVRQSRLTWSLCSKRSLPWTPLTVPRPMSVSWLPEGRASWPRGTRTPSQCSGLESRRERLGLQLKPFLMPGSWASRNRVLVRAEIHIQGAPSQIFLLWSMIL